MNRRWIMLCALAAVAIMSLNAAGAVVSVTRNLKDAWPLAAVALVVSLLALRQYRKLQSNSNQH